MGSVAREILVQDSDIFFGGIYNIFFLIIFEKAFPCTCSYHRWGRVVGSHRPAFYPMLIP